MAQQLSLIYANNTVFVDVVTQAKGHLKQFILWPYLWQQFQTNLNLNWQIYEFNLGSCSKIPNTPGVYAFLVQPRLSCNLDASYLMYVGKTDRALRTRYQEYLREAADPIGRPHIIDTLVRYSGYVYFSCATVVNQSLTPAQVEDELLAAFIPPDNPRLPAQVRRIKAAF